MFRPITPVKVLEVVNSNNSPWLENINKEDGLTMLVEQSVINSYGIQEHRIAKIKKATLDVLNDYYGFKIPEYKPGEILEGNLIYHEIKGPQDNWEVSKFINFEGQLVDKEFLGSKISRFLIHSSQLNSTDQLIIPTNYFNDYSFIRYPESIGIDPEVIGFDLVDFATNSSWIKHIDLVISKKVFDLLNEKGITYDFLQIQVEMWFAKFFKNWFEDLIQFYPPFNIEITKKAISKLAKKELELQRNHPYRAEIPKEIFKNSQGISLTPKHHAKAKTKGGNKITYGIDYVPLNRDVEVTEAIENDRNFIYAFKNGNYTQKHIQMLQDLIDPRLYTLTDGKMKFHEWTVILTIPASTGVKQEKRYMKFFEQFCENTDFLINGYKWVKVEHDREAIHTTESRKLTVNYSIALYMLTTNMLKNIIILDDLVTTGSSINQFMEELGKYKSKVKQIITFGATV